MACDGKRGEGSSSTAGRPRGVYTRHVGGRRGFRVEVEVQGREGKHVRPGPAPPRNDVIKGRTKRDLSTRRIPKVISGGRKGPRAVGRVGSHAGSAPQREISEPKLGRIGNEELVDDEKR